MTNREIIAQDTELVGPSTIVVGDTIIWHDTRVVISNIYNAGDYLVFRSEDGRRIPFGYDQLVTVEVDEEAKIVSATAARRVQAVFADCPEDSLF